MKDIFSCPKLLAKGLNKKKGLLSSFEPQAGVFEHTYIYIITSNHISFNIIIITLKDEKKN